jgi:hypothetical protein
MKAQRDLLVSGRAAESLGPPEPIDWDAIIGRKPRLLNTYMHLQGIEDTFNTRSAPRTSTSDNAHDIGPIVDDSSDEEDDDDWIRAANNTSTKRKRRVSSQRNARRVTLDPSEDPPSPLPEAASVKKKIRRLAKRKKMKQSTVKEAFRRATAVKP